MKRTNVVMDDKLVRRAKRLTGIRTTRDMIDHALKTVVRLEGQRSILKLVGKVHWEGNLEESRKAREF